MKGTWLIAGVATLGAALSAHAQQGGADRGAGQADVTPAQASDGYQGVTPGGTESPPAERRVRARQRRARSTGRHRRASVHLLTWPGFQMRDDGSSRFFLQTSTAVELETHRTPGRFEVVLKDTRVHLRTNALPLETRYFNTPVVRARIERRGKDLAVIFELRAEVTPRVHTEASDAGYHYVFVDFPAGDYLPAALEAEREADGAPGPDRAGDEDQGPSGEDDPSAPGVIRVYGPSGDEGSQP